MVLPTLIPYPKSLTLGKGKFRLSDKGNIHLLSHHPELEPLAQKLQELLCQFVSVQWMISNNHSTSIAHIDLELIKDSSCSTQSYTMIICESNILLQSTTLQGLFYSIMTLKQLLRQYGTQLPNMEIIDQPDLCIRGIMLDISRDKIPNMTTLFELIERFAELKINHLQMYTEHTFAYSQHPKVWQNASPLTGEEVMTLTQYCKQHFIDLVPNQNCFGHLHKWLSLPEYNHLAECPNGFKWPWGDHSLEPFSLNPTLGESLTLIQELLSELVPHFQSQYCNVGCDETFDLGQCHSKAQCLTQGKGVVYLDYLLKVHQIVQSMGKTMMCWGDILLEYPELVSQLPTDVHVLEWGYEANHPFDEHGKLFAESGLTYLVCPGTSAWNSLSGRTKNCLQNIQNAVASARKYGAKGMLLTDWGDRGHWQHLPISYLGYVAAAGISWNYENHHTSDFIPELNLHVFQDTAGVLGKAFSDLGHLDDLFQHSLVNNTLLFQILYRDTKHSVFSKFTQEEIQKVQSQIAHLKEKIDHSKAECSNAHLIVEEFQHTCLMLEHASLRAVTQLEQKWSDSQRKKELSQHLQGLIEQFKELWFRRNRSGGLTDSLQRFYEQLDFYQGRKERKPTRFF